MCGNHPSPLSSLSCFPAAQQSTGPSPSTGRSQTPPSRPSGSRGASLALTGHRDGHRCQSPRSTVDRPLRSPLTPGAWRKPTPQGPGTLPLGVTHTFRSSWGGVCPLTSLGGSRGRPQASEVNRDPQPCGSHTEAITEQSGRCKNRDIVSRLPHSNPDGFPLPVRPGFLLSPAVPRSPRRLLLVGGDRRLLQGRARPPPHPRPQACRAERGAAPLSGLRGRTGDDGSGARSPGRAGQPGPAQQRTVTSGVTLHRVRGHLSPCPVLPPEQAAEPEPAAEGLPKARARLPCDKRGVPFLWRTELLPEGCLPPPRRGPRPSPRCLQGGRKATTPAAPAPSEHRSFRRVSPSGS